MHLWSLYKKRSKFLLAVYLYVILAGTFHYHSYFLEFDGETRVAQQHDSHSAGDFFDPSTGTCSFEHFSQSINSFDLSSIQIELNLPEFKESIVLDSWPDYTSISHHSSSLRAPPAI